MLEEKIRVKLKGSLAHHPYYGAIEDVLDLPLSIAIPVLEQKNGVCIKKEQQEAFEKAQADGGLEDLKEYLKAAQESEVEKAEEPESEKVEERVDQHMAGLDELFDKQKAAQEPEVEQVAEPVKEKKGKK